jgi:hypothetical protein
MYQQVFKEAGNGLLWAIVAIAIVIIGLHGFFGLINKLKTNNHSGGKAPRHWLISVIMFLPLIWLAYRALHGPSAIRVIAAVFCVILILYFVGTWLTDNSRRLIYCMRQRKRIGNWSYVIYWGTLSASVGCIIFLCMGLIHQAYSTAFGGLPLF